MRRLIINADDLGITPGVNRGIAECARAGVVTSTTLMANAGAFDDALRMVAEQVPTAVSVGCHVTLVDGAPLLPASSVTTLLADGGGGFRPGFGGLARATFAHRINPDEVRAEATAQLRKLQQAGIRLSHLDTHKHAHMLPGILKPLLQAARECGLRALRNPFAPIKPLASAHLLRRPRLWTRYAEVRVLRGWHEAFRRAVAAEGMVTTDGTFGILTTGALDARLFRAIIGNIPEGTWEFCCHPGYNDGALEQVRTRLRASRDRERAVLTSAEARDIIESCGIELISYWDLQ